MPNRKKTPRNLMVSNTFRKDRHSQRKQVQPDIKQPTCPTWLDPPAKAEWKRVTKLLKPLRVLAEVDQAGLATYCTIYSQIQQNPKEANSAMYAQLRMYLGEFGLTPAARTKLPVPELVSTEPNPFEGIGRRPREIPR